MDLAKLFNPALIRRIRDFHIDDTPGDLRIWATVRLYGELHDVSYRLHQREWRLAIDLAVDGCWYLRDVFIENLAFAGEIDSFVRLMRDKSDDIQETIRGRVRHHEDVAMPGEVTLPDVIERAG